MTITKFDHPSYDRETIARALRLILGAPGVQILEESGHSILLALAFYTTIRQLSFADCYHAALALDHCNGEIYTFDQDFGHVPDLTRLEPEFA